MTIVTEFLNRRVWAIWSIEGVVEATRRTVRIPGRTKQNLEDMESYIDKPERPAGILMYPAEDALSRRAVHMQRRCVSVR